MVAQIDTQAVDARQGALGPASIMTTADIYVDWDLDQLAETMREVLEDQP